MPPLKDSSFGGVLHDCRVQRQWTQEKRNITMNSPLWSNLSPTFSPLEQTSVSHRLTEVSLLTLPQSKTLHTQLPFDLIENSLDLWCIGAHD